MTTPPTDHELQEWLDDLLSVKESCDLERAGST